MEVVRGCCEGKRGCYNTLRKLDVDQVLWKLPGVVVQVTVQVTTPRGSWGGDQVLWKLQGVVVQVAGLVTTPGGSFGSDQVLWKLPGVVVPVTGLVTTPGGSGVLTRSCGSCHG